MSGSGSPVTSCAAAAWAGLVWTARRRWENFSSELNYLVQMSGTYPIQWRSFSNLSVLYIVHNDTNQGDAQTWEI